MNTITNPAAFADGWIARELEDWEGRTKDEIRDSLAALRRDIGPHLLAGEAECGEDHIIGSRPHDCFACLSEHRDRLLAALKIAQPEFCSMKCPSVFRGPDSERHVPACVEMQAAIDEAEGK